MQAFHAGDWVRVAGDLGPSMRHFPAGGEAIVMGSYDDLYGGGDHASYSLYLHGRGETSWYYEGQLELVEHGRFDLLDQWRVERALDETQKGDLDWIFSNGPEVLEKGYGASIQALAESCGVVDLWGARGQGIDYYANALAVLAAARRFLESGDKAGWLEGAERMKRARQEPAKEEG